MDTYSHVQRVTREHILHTSVCVRKHAYLLVMTRVWGASCKLRINRNYNSQRWPRKQSGPAQRPMLPGRCRLTSRLGSGLKSGLRSQCPESQGR